MTEAKHTRGPWVVCEKQMHQPFLEIAHRDQRPGAASAIIARVSCRQSWQAEQFANAKLIAAAPDLLAELRTVVFHLIRNDFKESDSLRHQAIDHIEATIAKATAQ